MIGSSGGLFEHGNEFLGSVKFGEYFFSSWATVGISGSIGPIIKGPEVQEVGTDTFSRNVGTELPLNAA
jgi:hypothetical protein